jgi:hypothetical protein
MRPIADTGDQAVFDRIDITILDVSAEILVIVDQMFPEPTLPDASFATRFSTGAAQGAALIAPYGLRLDRPGRSNIVETGGRPFNLL